MKFLHRSSLLLVALLLGVATVQAQHIGDRYQGSAPALQGSIFVLTCYVSETGWSEEEVESFRAMRDEAEDWLVEQAWNYRQEVSFVNSEFGGFWEPLLLDSIVSGNGVGNEPVDLVSKLMPMIGYDNGLAFVEWVKNNTDCDGCLVLIVANKPGRGYSMAYKNNYNEEMYFLEGTMLYTAYREDRPNCAAGIAHEMCHLFGAEDLYATFIQSEENEARARDFFPDDIMLRVSYDINTQKIDKLTAWLVGLTDEMEDWYLDFLYE